jgi:glucose/arabinose dehydrogenase
MFPIRTVFVGAAVLAAGLFWKTAWGQLPTAGAPPAPSAPPPTFVVPATPPPMAEGPTPPVEEARVPPPDPAHALLDPGFVAEVVTQNLVYPTSIEFDDQGTIYLAEAGFAFGDQTAPARVLMLTPRGVPVVMADHLNGPVNDLLWYQGRLYISHRGKISVLDAPLQVRDLVTGLPSLGDYSNTSMAVGPDGRIYFGVGAATNSGVVGLDNLRMGWLAKYPDFHDVPAHDVVLSGQVFETFDALTALASGETRMVLTAPFYAFGRPSPRGAPVRGQVMASGTILRMQPDGSGLEVFAWGLRNPAGLTFAPDGNLLVSDQGYEERGSRPIAGAPDCLWVVRNGGWYGFPDYAAGLPITDARFRPARGAMPSMLLQSSPVPERPLATFSPNSGVAKFAFSPDDRFGRGQIYLAMFGDLASQSPQPRQHAGFAVARVDTATWQVAPFFRAQMTGLEQPGLEYVTTAGPRRPVDVRFSPAGDALYVVDFGAVGSIPTAMGAAPRPYPGTGVLWRIRPRLSNAAPPVVLPPG